MTHGETHLRSLDMIMEIVTEGLDVRDCLRSLLPGEMPWEQDESDVSDFSLASRNKSWYILQF
jgi:hypothetical protein